MNELASAGMLSTAAELRTAFDGAFARPYAPRRQVTADYIGIRLGGEPHAFALGGIAGLHNRMTIVPCPGPLPELMGLAGFRGTLVPVYDLAVLLGHAPVAGRWLALLADRSVAFAFDEFEEHFRLEASAIAAGAPGGRNHIHTIARHGERAWPVIDLASLVAALKQRAGRAIPKKE